jgi:hypothetical protein
MIEAIRAQNNEICIIYFRLEKTEYSYFPLTNIGTSFFKCLYFPHSFENCLIKELQLSHMVSILGPRLLKILGTTTRLSYNLKKQILSEFFFSKTRHLYFQTSLHILPSRIVLYFPLDDFIISLALHVKVALSKTEHLYL